MTSSPNVALHAGVTALSSLNLLQGWARRRSTLKHGGSSYEQWAEIAATLEESIDLLVDRDTIRRIADTKIPHLVGLAKTRWPERGEKVPPSEPLLTDVAAILVAAQLIAEGVRCDR